MLALPAVLTAALFPFRSPVTSGDASGMCSMAPPPTIALLRVERDTTLPYTPVHVTPMSYSGVKQSPADSLPVMPGDPMPAARGPF